MPETAQPDLFGHVEVVAAKSRGREYLDTDLIAWAPCGCWTAVMVEVADFAENAKRIAEFARDAERDGGARVERIPHSRFAEIVEADKATGKTNGCNHDPQWGGMVATHRMCPRCHKDVRVRKDGTLAAHKLLYGPCSQVPYDQEQRNV